MLYDSEEEKLFVISGFAGYGHLRGTGAVVSVIDLATNRIIQQIGQREGFSDMVWHKKLNLIYLAKRNDKKLVVLDCKTFKIIDEIALGKKPDIMAINYNTNKIYLKCCNNYNISVIDISKKNVVELTHHNWIDCNGISFDSKTDRVYFQQLFAWGNESGGGFTNSICMIQGDSCSVQNFIEPGINKFVLMSNPTDFGVFFLIEKQKQLIVTNGRNFLEYAKLMHPQHFIVNPKTGKFYFFQ